MPVFPLAVVPPLLQGGKQLVVGIYHEVAPTHIIKKANEKYNEGIDVLERYRACITTNQLEEIVVMAQRVEAARPPCPSGSTTLLDMLRHPFNKIYAARKYKRVSKEYRDLVQRASQVARIRAAERDVLACDGRNGMSSQPTGPMTEGSHGSGILTTKVFDVAQSDALEIERAAGPGAEISIKFRDVKLSVGAKTSIDLHFTPSGIVTVNLGLIQVPSLTQHEEDLLPVLGASVQSALGEVAVLEGNLPHFATPQSNALARNSSVISLSGTATVFPRHPNHNPGDYGDTEKKADVINKANVGGEGTSGKLTYGLKFDNLKLEYPAEADVAPSEDD